MLLARIVLGVLAAYHVIIGMVSLLSYRGAARIVARLYGVASLDGSPQLRYAVKMLGLQALAIGALAAVAARDPADHRDVIAVLAALQAGRAFYRLANHQSLHDAFGIPAARNALNAAVLLAEAAILIGILV